MIGYCNRLCNSPQASRFSITELESGMQSLRLGISPGEDGIHNEMLINLEHDLKNELLSIINMSWTTGICPSSWMCGLIIPIHKSGKDKSRLASYRPVCLMSAVAKLAEILISGRLRYDLEQRKKITPYQSGFRTGRSTSDPLLRIVSDVHQGFHKHPQEHTMTTMVDFSRAFDKVNHQQLLLEFKELEVESCYARWYRSFLSNRRYQVRYGQEVSGFCRFANGVPQGSISGPLLFIMYVNSLSIKLSALQIEGLKHHFFADDGTTWITGRDINILANITQKGLNIITSWSRKYKLPVSVEKSEAILFSNKNSHQLNIPEIKLGEDIIPFSKAVRLLGIIMDIKLAFKEHVSKLTKETMRRLSQFRAIANATWGGSTRDNRAVYLAYINCLTLYCGAAYYPLLKQDLKDKIQKLENKAARIITGCLQTTNIESLLLEANLLPISYQQDIQCAITAERGRRMPAGDPLSITTLAYCPNPRLRTKRDCWQQQSDLVLDSVNGRVGRLGRTGNIVQITQAERLRLKIDLRNREPLLMFPTTPPWDTENANLITFKNDLIIPCTAADTNEVKKMRIDLTMAAHGTFDIELYTDGSVKDKLGAGAAMIYTNNGRNIKIDKKSSGYISTSYHAECIALQVGIEKIIKTDSIQKEGKSLLFVTDSQSMMKKLSKGPLSKGNKTISDIWAKLISFIQIHKITRVKGQFIYSHVGDVKGDAVDTNAKNAQEEYSKEIMSASHRKTGIPFTSLKAEVKRALKEKYYANVSSDTSRFLACENKITDLRFSSDIIRGDEVILNQLRVGECHLMGKYLSRINTDISPMCRWCNLVEETVSHVYSDCDSEGINYIREILDIKDVTVLHKDPVRGLIFCREAINLLNQFYG